MKKKFLCVALSAMMLLPTIPVSAKSKVSINKTSIALVKTKTYNLKLKNNKQKIKWTSSNKKIATVSKKGTVKGISNGSTKVTAKVGKKKYSCNIYVGKKIFENKYIKLYYTGINNKYLTFAVTNKVSHKLDVSMTSTSVDGKTLTSNNIANIDSTCSDLKKGQTKKLIYKIKLKNTSHKKLAFTGEIFDLNNDGYTVGAFYKDNITIGTTSSNEWKVSSNKELIVSDSYANIFLCESSSKKQTYYLENKSKQGFLITTDSFKVNGIEQNESVDYSDICIPPKSVAMYSTYYPVNLQSTSINGIFWICNLSGTTITEPTFKY
nr:Ig-like domain-containing protein [uncultured Anaerostipes sp.]